MRGPCAMHSIFPFTSVNIINGEGQGWLSLSLVDDKSLGLEQEELTNPSIIEFSTFGNRTKI